MWIIGLTGGIGSGKSSVAKWLENRGIPVLDADGMVHRLLSEDILVLSLIRETFGPGVISAKGEVDRPKLGKMVFADEKARKALESIIHPKIEVMRQMKVKALEQAGKRLSVWDVPLLFENSLETMVQETVLVWVPLEVQIARIVHRDRLSKEDILARIKAQMPLEDKAILADVVINNSGDWAETEGQLEKYWHSLEKRNLLSDI
ncbi:MAG: dephospho-CoA kinase [Desulfitobacteriaceae bacterium]